MRNFLDLMKNFDYINWNVDIALVEEKLNSKKNKRIHLLICEFFIRLVCSFRECRFVKPSADVVFLYGTKNQHDSLIEIYKELKKTEVISASVSISKGVKADFYIPNLIVYIFSILFLPITILEYFLIRSKNIRLRFLNGYIDYVLSFGRLVVYYFYFSLVKPKLLILSNDHNSNTRVAIYICKKLGIKICYVQHASVSKYFPALEQFDIALLDGMYSKDTYESIGRMSKKVYLIGISKLDLEKRQIVKQTINSNHSLKDKSYTIGIALNTLSNMNAVIDLVKKINMFDLTIILRPHPSQRLHKGECMKQLKELGCKFSNSKKESVAEFLNRCSFIAAGNSNILLESLILRTPAIYFQSLDDIGYDYYGFVKNNVAFELKTDFNLNDFSFVLKSFNTDSAKAYDDSINTEYYGYSSYYASNIIAKEIENLP